MENENYNDVLFFFQTDLKHLSRLRREKLSYSSNKKCIEGPPNSNTKWGC